MTPLDNPQDELIGRLRKMAKCIYIAVEATVADDIADGLNKAAIEIEALRKQIGKLTDHRLFVLATLYEVAPQTVAKMCDETLDRSGALLGEVRELSRRSAQPEPSS